MATAVLDVVSEDPEVEHVPDYVERVGVEEHGREYPEVEEVLEAEDGDEAILIDDLTEIQWRCDFPYEGKNVSCY